MRQIGNNDPLFMELKPMRQKRTWVYSPAKPKIPESLKQRVLAESDKLVEEVFKPRYLKPPPEAPLFNYITDIYTKWFRGYLYFSSTYASPGPDALSPSFEAPFTRLEY